jgi:O-antigen ligase
MKILSWGTILLAALLPFEWIPTWEVAGFTVKMSYVLLVVLLPIGLWHIRKDLSWKSSSIADRFLLVFLLSSFASQFWSPDLRRTGVIGALWVLMILAYFFLQKILSKQELYNRVVGALIAISVAVSLFGLYQFFGDMYGLPLSSTGLRLQYSKVVFGFPRIQATALEPLYLANFLLVPFYLALSKWWQTGKAWFAAAGILILTIIVMGISRGAYLALLISLPLLLVFTVRMQSVLGRVPWKKIAGMIGISSVSIVLGLTIIRFASGSQALNAFTEHAQVSDAQTEGASVDSRRDSYAKAIELFKQQPLFGHGPGSVGPLTKTNQAAFEQNGYGLINNQYLELLAESGLIGTVLYVGFLLSLCVVAFRMAWREQSVELLFLIAGVFAVFVQYNFFSTLYILHIWFYLALVASWLLRGNGAGGSESGMQDSVRADVRSNRKSDAGH